MQIRWFDAATQVTLRTTDLPAGRQGQKQITLIPAGEIVFSEELIAHALKKIKKWGNELELPATLRREVAEKIENKNGFSGIETFLPAFYENSASLFDYLEKETILFFPEPDTLKQETFTLTREITELHKETTSPERLIPPQSVLYSYETLEEKMESYPSLPAVKVHLEEASQLKSKWSIKQFQEWRDARLKIRLVCHTPIQAERLQDLLRNEGIQTAVEVGLLSNGFGWMEEGLIILTEEEIFGHKTMRRTKSAKTGVAFSSFAELEIGDYLVHEEQGINRYEGLVHMKIQGVAGDFLKLEFMGGDRLYLPIYRLNAVQKYVSSFTQSVVLDRLGGIRWRRIKKKAGEQVYKIAQELLKIHAQRELHLGTSYPPPDALDEEFASHFPFDETVDQAKAIEEVLEDMQHVKPMDRLICGDVGYGKTEVAMRAAFKAVGSGKQVAVLVPTTILALQHFETFQERFSKLAISVDMLSRFRSAAEQKKTIAKLAEGKLDIVIGTHRLFAKDIRFKQLGLLIIDEEHRFGVKHKEKIKKIRPTVDVLTLSATPIPRTLHMSLIGLRDLSLIHTPPVDRLAIRTFVAKWDDAVIRNAIDQELSRGGQVFFVHNRVSTIESIHKRLLDLFPKIKISVAHGQMDEEELEKVMIDFLHQRTQILLTTTIIESGIDVPNANTIVINRADNFGLAQLYQLRGRVGRSDRQAYCYLLVPDEEMVTKEARQRLEALTRQPSLGAGFQIAEHDLEIRGAGNLVGTSQSGFIDEIGYELYTQLLAQTIRRLRGEKIEEAIDTEIHLQVAAFIPETYVADTSLRMELYKRLSHLSQAEEILSFQQELQDRFGEIPPETQNLLEVVGIRQLAMQLRLRSLQFDGSRFVFVWDPSTKVSPQMLI
ncbi:MAG: transcription-repair coupling factor, partial [Deltaproteobacteria bacterium]|nr:transcription-repair coupling factor [Deltaproteobacteria bacterium]